jgi:hypothetical protein
MLTKIFGLNVVHAEVCKVGEPWIFTWCRKPRFVDEYKLRTNGRCFTTKGTNFEVFHHDGNYVPLTAQRATTKISGVSLSGIHRTLTLRHPKTDLQKTRNPG